MILTVGILLDEMKSMDIPFTLAHVADYHASIAGYELCLNETLGVDDVLSILLENDNLTSDCMVYTKHLVSYKSMETIFENNRFETLVLVDESFDKTVLLNFIQSIFQKYHKWSEELLQMILRKKSLQNILDHISQILSNPIALLDNQMMIMASAGEFKNKISGTIWEKVNDPDFSLATFFSTKEQQLLSRHSSTMSKKPYIYKPEKDPNHEYMTAHIWLNNKIIGNLGSVSINNPFTEGQLALLESVRTNIELYFMNNEDLISVVEDNHRIIELILSGQDVQSENISFYLNRLGWQKEDSLTLCVFSTPIEIATPIEDISFMKLLKQHYPRALIVSYDKYMVMITRTLDYSFSESRTLEQLRVLCKEQNLHCGISSEFQNFYLIRYYYAQGKFSSEFCRKKPNQFLCFYETCQPQHITESLSLVDDLKSYCHPKLLQLWNSKNANDKELVTNLYTYLVHGKNITESAKELFIHRNTLIYRISKLSEHLETDFQKTSSDILFYYLISCLILTKSKTD